MRVLLQKRQAVVFDDYGQLSKIEGPLYRRLVKEFFRRSQVSTKNDSTILAEIVQGWNSDVFEWVPVSEANK